MTSDVPPEIPRALRARRSRAGSAKTCSPHLSGREPWGRRRLVCPAQGRRRPWSCRLASRGRARPPRLRSQPAEGMSRREPQRADGRPTPRRWRRCGISSHVTASRTGDIYRGLGNWPKLLALACRAAPLLGTLRAARCASTAVTAPVRRVKELYLPACVLCPAPRDGWHHLLESLLPLLPDLIFTTGSAAD